MVRFFGSTKLTVLLCLLLSAGGIAGSLLYRGNTAFGKPPAFNVFRSPLFLVPAGLLVVNVLFCVVPRLREMPVRRPRTWTFAALHLGLLFLAAGLGVDGLFGFVGTQYFPVGVPHAGYYDWRTGRNEAFPFTVEVTSAEVRHYPLKLRIGVRDAAGNRVGTFVVREGVPFSLGKEDVVVTPRRFEADSRTLHLDATVRGARVTGLSASAEVPASVAGFSILPLAYADPEPSDYIARVRFAAPGSLPQEQLLRINHPGSFGGISFCIMDVNRDRFRNAIVGLQMTREPGGPIFWGGALLFGASLLLHLSLKGAGAGRRAGIPAAVAAAILLLPAFPPDSRASGVVIDREATWSGEVRVTEPVSVEKGATLRILPGTVVLLSGEDREGDGCEDGYIQVFGELRVEGTPDRPVRFARLHPDRPWREIFLKDARATVRNAVIEGAVWGLHIHDGEVRIEESVIRGNGGGARMRGLGVAIRHCEIRENGIGLRFWDGGPQVSASVIEGNGTGLFYRDGTGGGKITGSRIRNREWDVKVGDWAIGDLDLSGNYWGAVGTPRATGAVQDYRERRNAGKVAFDRPLPEPPAGAGPGGAR